MNVTTSKDERLETVPRQAGTRRAAVSSGRLSPRRVNLPRAVVGGLGVVVCSLGTVAASHVLDPRTAVLVVTQPVAAGQTITAADVRSVPVSTGSGVDAVPAAQVASVIGHPAALPLAPGALLGRADVGTAAFPPPGQAVTAVGLKAGMYPLHLAAGDRVQVILPASLGVQTASQATESETPVVKPFIATVTAVGKPDTQGTTVANLLMDEDGAAQVAAAATSTSGVAVTVLSAGDS